MKKFISAALAAVLVLCCAGFSACRKNQTEIFELPREYKLSFSEEFENGYDENIWSSSEFNARKGGYWSNEQVFTENDNLIIRTEYRENEDACGYYTGELSWSDIRSTYGYYEIRCKVDNIRGAWSAFWLMPDNISNMKQKAQDGCEIDIFESALPNRVQNTLHYDGYKSSKKNITKLNDMYDGYHTYALDWKKNSMKFYYDNKLLWKVTDPDLISAYPVYMNISTEINGKIKNDKPEASRWLWLGCGKIDDKENRLPSDFVVDYVRVYDNGDLIWSEKESTNEN